MKWDKVTCSTVFLASLILLWAGAAWGDTLLLRSGQRVEGELLSVRGDRIEFEDDRGRVTYYDRSEVRSIELHTRGRSRYGDRDFDPTRGMREKSVHVNANMSATDTGIDVLDGQEVYFKASGKVQWGPGRKDGPAGEGGNEANPNRPIPNRPAASLIGRVGSTGWFYIGDEKAVFEMRSSGRLYLAINDDYLVDNRGAFRVTIYY